MGQTFANITVKGQAQDALVDYLKQFKRNAYVSPSTNNFVVVYDEEFESETEKLSNLSIQISEDFGCLIFAVFIYDESIFNYELYNNGDLLDKYSSYGIDLFPEGGNSQKLCTVLGVKQLVNKVRPILKEPSTEKAYLFASVRHKRLVKELRLPIWSTDTIGGYRNIEEGEIDAIIFDEDDFPDVEATLSMLKNTFE